MILIVKRKDNGQIHLVTQYNGSEEQGLIWAENWPGLHRIGVDCEWEALTDDEWRWITFIRDNPEFTVRELVKELKTSYWIVYRLVKRYQLAVKIERPRGDVKKKFYVSKKRI
jgi:hypothetical protein